MHLKPVFVALMKGKTKTFSFERSSMLSLILLDSRFTDSVETIDFERILRIN